jgi:hypothetical protein
VLVDRAFKVEPFEMENIAMSNIIASQKTHPTASLSATADLGASLTAITSRVDVLLAYLSQVQSGALPPDYPLLRRISLLLSPPALAAAAAGRADEKAAVEGAALHLAEMGRVAQGVWELGKGEKGFCGAGRWEGGVL